MRALALTRFILPATLVSGCAPAASGSRPPAGSEPERARPGDVVTLRVDDWLGGELRVDECGAVQVPSCGKVLVAGRSAKEVEDAVARCLVDASVYEAAPSVWAQISPTTPVQLVARDGRVWSMAWEPGLSLVSLLSVGLGRVDVGRVFLDRAGDRYDLSPRAMAEGREPDVPIRPGDRVLFEDDGDFRAPRKPYRPASVRVQPADVLSERDCGQLLLDEAALASSGLGPKHPRLVRVREALASECGADDDVRSIRAACLAALADEARSAAELGPRHPKQRDARARVARCVALGVGPDSPGPPPARSCSKTGDCARGEICCLEPDSGFCVPRESCARAEVCEEGSCSTGGTICRKSASEPRTCGAVPRKLLCGGRRCDEKAPFCRAEDGGFRCTSDPNGDDVYECATSADCGGKMQCCGPADGSTATACAFACPFPMTVRACKTDVDCLSDDPVWQGFTRCKPAERGPGGLSFCVPP